MSGLFFLILRIEQIRGGRALDGVEQCFVTEAFRIKLTEIYILAEGLPHRETTLVIDKVSEVFEAL